MSAAATSVIGVFVIFVTVGAIIRRTEVRLTLICSAFVLGLLAGTPMRIVTALLAGLTDEKFLLPVGSCMGFAYLLRHTGCDRQLVLLLVKPLQTVRFLLVPGVVVVGLLVNLPIISQAGTAVVVGTVICPVLIAARISRKTIGASLALGASIGGELLNPGAPELRTITAATHATTTQCVENVWPLLLIHVGVVLPLFWLLCGRRDKADTVADASAGVVPIVPVGDLTDFLRPNIFKALVSFVPLLFLSLTALPGPLRVFTIKPEWLGNNLTPEVYDGRLVGLAMLIGVVVAALSSPSKAGSAGTQFFEGVGYALANVTSLVVAANCFGEGIRAVGLATHLETLITSFPGLLFPLAALIPIAFAWICGSGFAATQSLYGFFVDPANMVGADPLRVGAIVSLSAAAGRTMSPVAAVNLVSGSITGCDSFSIVRRVAMPLLAGVVAIVLVAALTR
jgi:DcuC family C4-dicarboxylate transporter